MNEQQIERARAEVPDDPVKMPDSFLSCLVCGIAVARTSDMSAEIQLTTSGRAMPGVAGMTEGAVNQRPTQLSFSLCPEHRRTAEIAEQLVADPQHRPLRAMFGEETAQHQVSAALDAISFCAGETVERMAYLDPEGLSMLVRQLSHLGSQARWAAKFVPVMSPEADIRSCCPRPWSHLMLGARQSLRQAYAALLKERAARGAPDVRVPPPAVSDLGTLAQPVLVVEHGCLCCGLGTQQASAAAIAREGRKRIAEDLWVSLRASTEQLGGRPSPQQLSGFLCRPCSNAIEQVHSIGPSALLRALTVTLCPEKTGLLGWDQLQIDNLVGFGALVAQAHRRGEPPPQPNTQAWQHLGDLSSLAEQLSATLGG